MPPLQDGDPYRSMSVVPYLEDLHSPESGSTSLIDEDDTTTETLCVPGEEGNKNELGFCIGLELGSSFLVIGRDYDLLEKAHR